jgi:hypothetical protein
MTLKILNDSNTVERSIIALNETVLFYIHTYVHTYKEERWLNGSAPDCKSVVLGSNPAPPQHTANSVSPEVGSHLGWHSMVYTKKPIKI